MRVEKTIQQAFEQYPTLYAWNRLKVLDQFLLTNGNGAEWYKGELVFRPAIRDTNEEEARVREQALKTLRQYIADGKQLPDITGRCSNYKTDLQQYIEVEMIAKSLYQPIKSYQISTGEYSAVGCIPDNIKDDWLAASIEVLREVLLRPECNRGDHAAALVILTRLHKRFGVKGDFIDLIEEGKNRRCQLDCKRHVDNYTVDDSRLTPNEYLEYYGCYTKGYSEEDIAWCAKALQKEQQEEVGADEERKKEEKVQQELLEFIAENATVTKDKIALKQTPLDKSLANYLLKQKLILKITKKR